MGSIVRVYTDFQNMVEIMVKISIIIPVYNAEKYIAETLDSALAQTFKDFEIICVDDGSTDKSAKILKDYAKKDKRIKIISQKNSGVVTARNNAIAQSSGKYIYTLDSDDLIEKTTLEQLYRAINANKGDIITTRVMYFGTETGEMVLPQPTKKNMARQNCLVNAALFKRTLFDRIGGFDTAFNDGLEDYDFWLNAIYRQKCRFYRIPEILFYYRQKPLAESRNEQQKATKNAELINYLKQKYPQMRLYRFLSNIGKWCFQLREKPNKTIVRVLKLPLLETVQYPKRSWVFAFGLFPVWSTKRKTLGLLYFNSVQNFGDILNVELFKMFNTKVIRADAPYANVIAIGSLLQTLFTGRKPHFAEKFASPLIVYGSGFIEDTPATYNSIRRLDVRAVRGYNSLEKLKHYKNVKIADNVAIGDPGLLAGRMFDTSKIKKKYDLGIIPHYVDKDSPLLKKIKVKNSIIIDIQQEPHKVIEQIAQCKNIISSAMHGLIVADSLGIPNIRMVLSDKITGGDYKYNDYYSAFGIRKHTKFNLSKQSVTDKDLPAIKQNYKITTKQVSQICDDLIKAFPYKNGGTK